MSQAGDYLAGLLRHKEESRAIKSLFSGLSAAFQFRLHPGISADLSGVMPRFITASLDLTPLFSRNVRIRKIGNLFYGN